MGESLFELEQLLRSKEGKFTSQEANILLNCKAEAIKGFTIGAAAGGAISWLATQRLNRILRINISAGTALTMGFWRFGAALDSCVEHILSLDGSRMQKELANIILQRNRGDTQTMQLISKHFYSERVFDDTSTDQVKIRWRYRNFFGESGAHSEQTNHGGESYGHEPDVEKTEVKNNTDKPNQVFMKNGMDSMADPLDCVFGNPGSSSGEIHHDKPGMTTPKRHGRSHRRSHRRHRMRHREAPLNSELA